MLRDPGAFLIDVGVIGGIVVVVALVGLHYLSKPVEVKERTEEETAEPELPPLVPLKTAAEVAEVEDKTAWLGDMAEMMDAPDDLRGGRLNLERPAGALLCDRPQLPPRDSELWLTIRLAAMRTRPLSWRRLETAIGPEWTQLVTTRAKTLEATQEITPETLAKVLGGVK